VLSVAWHVAKVQQQVCIEELQNILCMRIAELLRNYRVTFVCCILPCICAVCYGMKGKSTLTYAAAVAAAVALFAMMYCIHAASIFYRALRNVIKVFVTL
jgi:hypothetical protein